MATDIRIWDGTQWQSIVGEQGPMGPDGPDGPDGPQGERGPPGPSAVSANAGNATRLGTDNLVHTPISPDAENELRLRPNGLYARTLDLNGLRDVVLSQPRSGQTLVLNDSGEWANDTLISSEPGNTARLGTDGKIFTPAVTGGGGGGDTTGDYLPLTGGVLTGSLTAEAPSGTATTIRVRAQGGAVASQVCERFSNDAAGPLFVVRKARGTQTAQVAPVSGDVLGEFRFTSVNASGTGTQAGTFLVACSGTPTAGAPSIPAQMRLFVSDGVTTGPTRGLTISSDGTCNMTKLAVSESATIAQGGLNSTAIGPMNIEVKTADYQLQLTDAGKIVTNGSTAATGVISFRIPTNAATPFPIGTVIEIMDASATTTAVVALAGVTLLWNNPNYSVSPAGSLAGGVAATSRLRGRLTTARLLKAGTDTWYLFGDLEAT